MPTPAITYSYELDLSNAKREFYYLSATSEINTSTINNSGLKVYKVWSNGRKNRLLLGSGDGDYSIEISSSNSNPRTIEIVVNDSEVASKLRTFSYEVAFTKKALSTISISVDDSDINFNVGSPFSYDTLKVTAIFNDGSIVNDNAITKVSNSEGNYGSNQDVKRWVVLEEGALSSDVLLSGTFTVTVYVQYRYDTNPKFTIYSILVIGIADLVVEPQKTKYFIGDSFNPNEDLIVNVYYNNRTSQTISANGITYIGSSLLEEGHIFRTASTIKITVKVVGIDGNILSEDYIINVVAYNGKYSEEHTHLKVAFNIYSITRDGKVIYFGRTQGIYPLFEQNKVEIDTLTWNGYNVYNGQDADIDCKGYVVVERGSNGHIVLFDDYTNITHDGNIIVKYPSYNSEYKDRIDKCRFGHIFNNRLFVSGNPNIKNCDWHTSDVNIDQQTYENSEDYTYFADTDYCYYGTNNTSVVGYDISRNGDLIVFKEDSDKEATLYKKSVKYENVVDSSGNTLSYVEDRYPTTDMNANGGVGGIKYNTIVNHLGDTIFVTKNGLKKLSYRQNIYENAKYTFDISSKINYKIKKENLENSILYNDKERLMLVTKEGLYIGIDNFRESEDYHELEWYYLDIKNAISFVSGIDNYIIYGDNNGNIYKLDFDKYYYKDRDRLFIESGGVTPSISPNILSSRIVDNAGLMQRVADEITYTTSDSYYEEGDIVHFKCLYDDSIYPIHAYMGCFNRSDDEISGNTFKVNDTDEFKDLFYEGREVYAYLINQTGTSLEIEKPYKLELEDDTNLGYVLYKLTYNGEDVSLSGVSKFHLTFALDENYEARITNLNKTNNTFQLLGDHDTVLCLCKYYSYTSYGAVITKEKNIYARYVTKPFDFGTILYEKNIYMWAFGNDTGLESVTELSYFTSRKQTAIEDEFDSRHMSAQNMNFVMFSFKNDMLPHIYSRIKNIRNISYMKLIFENRVDSNIVLENLTILCSLTRTAKGVK